MLGRKVTKEERRQIVRLIDEEHLTREEAGKRLRRDPRTVSRFYEIEKAAMVEEAEAKIPEEGEGKEEGKTLTERFEVFKDCLNLSQEVSGLKALIQNDIDWLQSWLAEGLEEFGIYDGDYVSVMNQYRFLQERCVVADPHKPEDSPPGSVRSREELHELEKIYRIVEEEGVRVYNELLPRIHEAEADKEKRDREEQEADEKRKREALEAEERERRARSTGFLLEAQRLLGYSIPSLDLHTAFIFDSLPDAMDWVRLVAFFFSRMPANLTTWRYDFRIGAFVQVVQKEGPQGAYQWIANGFPRPVWFQD